MLTLLKNYLFLRKLAKKYDFEVEYLFSSGRGWYRWMSFHRDQCIGVCLWDKYFNEILTHEVGHLLHAKRTNIFNYSLSYPNKASCNTLHSDGRETITKLLGDSNIGSFAKCIDMEGKASRYAMKVLRATGKKKKNSYKYLAKCLQSYLQFCDKKEIANVSYMMLNYIKG